MLSAVRASARLFPVSAAALALTCGLALAQPAAPAAPDPVVAKVNGQAIHLSDVKDAAQNLPPNVRSAPEPMLFPMLVKQLIDGHALLIEAHKTGLDKDPAVQRQLQAAQDQVLQNALLSKQVGPGITEDAIKARYQQDIAGKPGEEEVHARHILVDNEADAKKIIAELNKGGDFAALAKQHSKDTAAQGGDLGFFKKDEMVPEFATAAFALQPGQVSPTPVHSQFGWHVIQVIERRSAPPPTFEQAHDEIRQKLIHEGVQKVVDKARADVTVEQFNLDGSPIKATDKAAPPPAK